MMFNTLSEFYNSRKWRTFRDVVIGERLRNGYTIDEVTGEPIVNAYDIILHHKTELTLSNVNDPFISFNPDNIMIVSHRTHNAIHKRFGRIIRKVYCVYGPSRAGKSTYVDGVKDEGDLIVDMDLIWQSLGGRTDSLKPVAFRIRDALYDAILCRLGAWNNAYIVTTKPDRRVMDKLGAEYILINTEKNICLSRAETEEQKIWIESWFDNPPLLD